MSHTLVATLMKAKTGSPISKLILLKLADNADVHGRCFPSYQYLALYCEVSRLCCLIQRKGIPAHNASFLNNILSFRHT